MNNELTNIIDASDHLYNQEFFTVLKKETITHMSNEGILKVFIYKDSLRFSVIFRDSPCSQVVERIANDITQSINENKKGMDLLWYSQINGFSDALLELFKDCFNLYHFFYYEINKDDIPLNVDMKGLTCCKCTEDMIDTCIDILEDVFTPFPDSPGSFRDDKKRITSDFLSESGGTSLFFKDNEIVGFCGHNNGSITETVVRKKFQGQGYGEVIVRSVLKSIRELGYDADLTTGHYNERAIALYQKVGFKRVYESKRVTLPIR